MAIIAAGAVMIAILQWRTAEQQRLDAIQIQIDLNQERAEFERRLRGLSNDHRLDLERRELLFSTNLKEWEIRYNIIADRLKEGNRIIELQRSEIERIKNNIVPSPSAPSAPPITQENRDSNNQFDTNQIVGKWKAREGIVKINYAFYKNGTVERSVETIALHQGGLVGLLITGKSGSIEMKSISGTYKILSADRLTIELDGPLGTVKIAITYTMSNGILRMKEDSFLAQEIEYIKSPE